MTKVESNGPVTVLSNPDLEREVLLHLALLRVDAREITHHSGAYQHVQGWDWERGVLRADDQEALYEAATARLITVYVPAVEGSDRSLADPVPWRRLITLGVPAVTGNSVRITGMGWARLAAMNAAAGLVSAA